jgi:hypothetical protein
MIQNIKVTGTAASRFSVAFSVSSRQRKTNGLITKIMDVWPKGLTFGNHAAISRSNLIAVFEGDMQAPIPVSRRDFMWLSGLAAGATGLVLATIGRAAGTLATARDMDTVLVQLLEGTSGS